MSPDEAISLSYMVVVILLSFYPQFLLQSFFIENKVETGIRSAYGQVSVPKPPTLSDENIEKLLDLLLTVKWRRNLRCGSWIQASESDHLAKAIRVSRILTIRDMQCVL